MTSARYLGVDISSGLSWNSHIDRITGNANSTLGFLKRYIKTKLLKVRETAYNTLVRPKLEYASPIWDPHTKDKISQIEKVQRRAAQWTTSNYDYRSSVTSMIENLDNQLSTKQTPKTYVGPAGTEVSTIDYIFYSEGLAKDLIGIDVLEDLALNVSDHYPLLCTLNIQLDVITSSSTVALPPTKTRWDKVDKALYEQAVSECVSTLQSGSGSLGALDAEICKLNKILVEAAEKAGPTRVKRPRKAKLKTWNDDIKQAVQSKKRAFMEWKLADRPNDPGDILVQNKKLTTMYLRRLCRIEAAACRENERQQILDAKSADMNSFTD